MIYKAVCSKCNKPRTISYKPKEINVCKNCSAKVQAKKAQKFSVVAAKKRQTQKRVYICPACPNIRMGHKRKTPYCATCSRKINKSKIKYYFDLDKMKIIKIDNYIKKEVVEKQKVEKKKRTRKPKKKNTYLKIGFDGKQKVNITKREKPKRVLKSEDEMIQEYLASNKVTVIEPLSKTA